MIIKTNLITSFNTNIKKTFNINYFKLLTFVEIITVGDVKFMYVIFKYMSINIC